MGQLSSSGGERPKPTLAPPTTALPPPAGGAAAMAGPGVPMSMPAPDQRARKGAAPAAPGFSNN
jgi:hypothetical protein